MKEFFSNPIVKTVLGSILRHWLGTFLAVIGTRAGLDHATSGVAVGQLTDDTAANLALSFAVAVPLVIMSVYQRLKLKLRARVALCENPGATMSEVVAKIDDTPGSQRFGAVMTLNPAKLEENARL